MLIIVGFHFSNAQINEIGVFLGGSNPIADVGSDVFVRPNKPAYGILYKWNAHQKFSFRAQFGKVNLLGNDADSNVEAKKNRNFRFENDLLELGIGVEYHFIDFDMSKQFNNPISPYIYTGVVYFWQDDLFYDMRKGTENLTARPTKIRNGETARDKSWAIPIGLGIKTKISTRFLIGLELVTRLTFTKNLDGSFPSEEKYKAYRFGNENSFDWYSTIGLTFTYTFGEYPCYCR